MTKKTTVPDTMPELVKWLCDRVKAEQGITQVAAAEAIGISVHSIRAAMNPNHPSNIGGLPTLLLADLAGMSALGKIEVIKTYLRHHKRHAGSQIALATISAYFGAERTEAKASSLLDLIRATLESLDWASHQATPMSTRARARDA